MSLTLIPPLRSCRSTLRYITRRAPGAGRPFSWSRWAGHRLRWILMAAVSKPSSLQQAASVVFAVTTVVPLLVFVWTLHRLGALSDVQSQVGLGLALGIALLGFYIFRRLMGRMSQLIHGLGRVVQQGMRPADSRGNGRAGEVITEYRPPVRDHQGQPAAAGQAASTRGASASAPATPLPASATAELARPEHRSASIPGLGMIREVDDLSHAMAKLWRSFHELDAGAVLGRLSARPHGRSRPRGSEEGVRDRPGRLEGRSVRRQACRRRRARAQDPLRGPEAWFLHSRPRLPGRQGE